MAYRKRVFLNPISLSAPSFIQAVADSSDEGTYLLGNYVLIIGDCRRSVMLEFSLGNDHQRTISRKKIDKLFKAISEFREAVYAEAELIDKQGEVRWANVRAIDRCGFPPSYRRSGKALALASLNSHG